MIYFARQAGTDLVKIGYTYGDPSRRLSDLQTGQADPLRLMGVADGDEVTERNWHARFASSRVRGEWFRLTPPLACSIALANPLLREVFAFDPTLLVAAVVLACRPPSDTECRRRALLEETQLDVLGACIDLTNERGGPDEEADALTEAVELAILALGHPCYVPGCTCKARAR